MSEGKSFEMPAEPMRVKIELELSQAGLQLLATLDHGADPVAAIYKLIDHAQQGVYRPGAWERDWILSAFSGDFLERLEPGDPFGRPGCEDIFCRPSADFIAWIDFMSEGKSFEMPAEPKRVKIELELSQAGLQLLATLDQGDGADPVAAIYELIDHAQQGVYRPGAWERDWILSAFSGDFLERLEPGDPFGRPGCEDIFCRPSADFIERLKPGFSE